jgi:hypothetical protein
MEQFQHLKEIVLKSREPLMVEEKNYTKTCTVFRPTNNK